MNRHGGRASSARTCFTAQRVVAATTATRFPGTAGLAILSQGKVWVKRVHRERDQKHRLRSLEGRWGVRLIKAGGNAHQNAGQTSGGRWDIGNGGGHGVGFALRLFNLTASKQNLHRLPRWEFRMQTELRRIELHQRQHLVQLQQLHRM